MLDYLEGIDLYAYQRECVMLSLDVVKYCAATCLQMLTKLHEQEVIYRDLKPDNIMVKRNSGKLVLVDFGFAKSLH